MIDDPFGNVLEKSFFLAEMLLREFINKGLFLLPFLHYQNAVSISFKKCFHKKGKIIMLLGLLVKVRDAHDWETYATRKAAFLEECADLLIKPGITHKYYLDTYSLNST